MKSPHFLPALLGILILSSCSTATLSKGPNLAKYDAPQLSISRKDVIADLGQPARTFRMESPRGMASIDAARPGFGRRINPGLFAERKVLTVDEYKIRGPVYDRYRNRSSNSTAGVGVMTLGLSELYMYPASKRETEADNQKDRRLFMFYDPSDQYIDYSLVEVTKVKP